MSLGEQYINSQYLVDSTEYAEIHAFYYPLEDNITISFVDAFGAVQGRITLEHRILRAPLDFTAKSLPATAGSTFHVCAASRARQGAPCGNRATPDKLRIIIAWTP